MPFASDRRTPQPPPRPSSQDADRGGRAKVTIVGEHAEDDGAFWEALGGGTASDIPAGADDDGAHEKKAAAATALHRVSDESGALEITQVPKDDKGKLQR